MKPAQVFGRGSLARHFLGDLLPRHFPRGSQLVHDGGLRRPRRARQLFGEFFKLQAHRGLAFVGGDEVWPDGEQGLHAEAEQIANEE